MQICQQCGNLFEDERLECPNCGASVSRKIGGVKSIPSQFASAIKTCFCKYVSFNGRASCSEFWYWILFCWIIGVLEAFLLSKLPKSWTPEAFLIRRYVVVGSTGYVTSLFNVALKGAIIRTIARPFTLALFLPTVAVSVRRLHDAGYSCVWTILYYAAKFAIFIVGIRLGRYAIDHVYDASFDHFQNALTYGLTGASLLLSAFAFLFMIKEGDVGSNKYGEKPCASVNEGM